MADSKSQRDETGGRKLAAGHGRAKQKSGGESQKPTAAPRGSGGRTGSSK